MSIFSSLCHLVHPVPQAYSAAQSASEDSRRAVEEVTALLTVRSEAEEKLKKLQQEIAAAEAMGPAQVWGMNEISIWMHIL